LKKMIVSSDAGIVSNRIELKRIEQPKKILIINKI
jgi:hypothetical protein